MVDQAELDRMGRSKKGSEKHAAIEEYGILQNEPQMNADKRGLIAALIENRLKY